MKKIILVALVAAFLGGCADTANINGKTYDSYGLFNEKTAKNDAVEYAIIPGNVIWSIILCETVVMPVYFIGFSLYEPIGPKGSIDKGVIR